MISRLLRNILIASFVCTAASFDSPSIKSFTIHRGELSPLDQIRVHIDVDSESLHMCTKEFLSVGIDSDEIRWKWKGFDFGSQKLKNLAAALAPSNLRLGGTMADFLTFSPDGHEVEERKEHGDKLWRDRYKYDSGFFDGLEWKKDWKNFTMTGMQWDNITSFSKEVGWDIMFDFNLFKWRKGLWDPSNAELLLNYSTARDIQIPAFQLGNEPNSFRHNFNITIEPETLARDYGILKQLLSRFPAFKDSGLYGPEVTSLGRHAGARDYLEAFLKAGVHGVVNEISLHQYYLNGRTATVEQFLDPNVLDQLKTELDIAFNYTHMYPPPLPVRMTETSSCFGGGAPGLSDAYVAGFLWLDKLGMAAQYGVTTVFRQSFFGGNYALLDESSDPNPDYFLSVLYKRLVEGPVLKATIQPTSRDLRLYANCARTDVFGYPNGAVVFYFLNLRQQSVTLSVTQFQGHQYDLFLLTPGDNNGLKSRYVKLNGQILLMSGPTLPSMTGVSHTGNVTVSGQSFGFIVDPQAKAQACL